MFKTPLLQKMAKLMQDAHLLNQNPELTLDQINERRLLLKSTLAGSLLLLPVSGFLNACAHLSTDTGDRVPNARPNFKSNLNEDPVVILGAGIAGLTAAYELAKAGRQSVIYEASPRLGGRMFTKTNFNSERMTCELGGELVDTGHEDLIGLCKELNVELDDFATEDKGLEQNLYYFGGHYYTDKDLVIAFQPFAKRLQRDQKKAFPDAAPKGTITTYARQLDQLTLDDYLHKFTDVEKWVVDLIRIAYIGEMALDSNVQSATSMITTLVADTSQGFKLYGESDQAKRIRGGNISLIEALHKNLEASGVTIHCGFPLVSIKYLSTGLRLDFGDSSAFSVVAKKVICTLPFSTLREVHGIQELPMNPLKKKCIANTSYGTAAKMMLGYQSRPWRSGIKKGSFKIPASNGMVYTQLDVQNIWESSRNQPGNSGILSCYVGGSMGANLNLNQTAAFRKHVDEVFPEVDQIFDQNRAHFNWTRFTFGRGSYASAKAGETYIYGDVAGRSELSGQLHFAGEHTAGIYAGFMNGACRSGKLVAQAILKQKVAV